MGVRRDFDDEYARAVEMLPEFGKYLKSLLQHLLMTDGIQVHSVDYRV